jgi:hypothetical protein
MWLSERERIFIANYGVVAPTERSLLAWRLGVRVVGIGFIGFVMADKRSRPQRPFSRDRPCGRLRRRRLHL